MGRFESFGTCGHALRRYQYAAIGDATRVRALKVYRRHTQANAIDFINYVVKKFLFRIRIILSRTDEPLHPQLFARAISDRATEDAIFACDVGECTV